MRALGSAGFWLILIGLGVLIAFLAWSDRG